VINVVAERDLAQRLARCHALQGLAPDAWSALACDAAPAAAPVNPVRPVRKLAGEIGLA
jgi:hypothetical protein